MATTITTRVEDEIVKEIDRVAIDEAIDRSTVIRKFLIKSIKEWKICKSLEEYENGKITLWHAAKKCDISLWEIVDEAKKKHVHVPYSMNELEEDIRNLR